MDTGNSRSRGFSNGIQTFTLHVLGYSWIPPTCARSLPRPSTPSGTRTGVPAMKQTRRRGGMREGYSSRVSLPNCQRAKRFSRHFSRFKSQHASRTRCQLLHFRSRRKSWAHSPQFPSLGCFGPHGFKEYLERLLEIFVQ